MRTLVSIAGVMFCLAAGAFPCFAQLGEAPSERQVKAAFLLRFTEYVQWPAGTFAHETSPLVIGVVADDVLGAELRSLAAGRTVRGRPVTVRIFREREALSGVHALFVGEALNAQLRQITRAIEGPVLIVSEAEDGLSRGAVINFVIVERRVRFEVALGNAGAHRLTLGSGLLSVALNVRKDTRLAPAVYALRRPIRPENPGARGSKGRAHVQLTRESPFRQARRADCCTTVSVRSVALDSSAPAGLPIG